jgi:cytochrome c553
LLEVVLVCAGCHGMAGEGQLHAGYPRISGQPAPYLERQLAAYADGRRKSKIMSPIAERLSAQERSRLAQHYANAGAGGQPAPSRPKPSSSRGERLATLGDNGLRVQACQNCHGPDGAGRAPYGAYLAGLNERYLKEELLAWKSGLRDTDPSGAMSVIARHLPEADIDAVSAYYASLPAPPPVPSQSLHPPKPLAPASRAKP